MVINYGPDFIGIEVKHSKVFYDNKKIIILISSLIGCLNVLFLTNYFISMSLIFLELAVLAYFFIRKEIVKYLGSYLIFLCLSFEFGSLLGVEQFYGFKNFRLFGVNLGIISLLPIFLLSLLKGIKIKKIKQKYNKVYHFSLMIFLLNVTGIFFGLIQIIINDNNIQSMNGFLSSFLGVIYNVAAIPFLVIIAIFYILSWEEEKLKELDNYLLGVLIGVVVSMIVSYITGNYGRYGGVDTLLVNNLVIYTPFMLIIPFYTNYSKNKNILVFGIVGMILSIFFNSSGKLLILYIILPFLLSVLIIYRRNIIIVILSILFIPMAVVGALKSVDYLKNISILFNSKLGETLSILKFWEPNWILSMPLSPRTRIVEFINILYEYLNKPIYLLFGKGYMGTFTDHTGILHADYVQGAFSIHQWSNGAFYAPHETLNVLLLYHGLLGVFVYLLVIKFVFKNFTKSPWVLIGGFWFLIFYGFSVTLSVFGLIALILGFTNVEKGQNSLLE
jgi:hypothetical protein